ncbi:MAG: hypothetical protein PVI86_16735 [Phycisphaerae bacterium]|jgi:hypothetical protein
MSDAADAMTEQWHQPGTLDKTVTLASWGLAAALFLTVGWLTMAPDDPLGAVSVLTRQGAIGMIVQIAALGGVVGALATLIAGRRLPDVGPFAVALGLALVSLRGGTAEYLLLQRADLPGKTENALAVRFALGALGWFLVLAVSVLVSAAVQRWLFTDSVAAPVPNKPNERDRHPTLAGCDIPRLSTHWLPTDRARQTRPADGVKHMLIVAAIALAAMSVLSFGLSARTIRHGQTCFIVAASVCIGVYVAYRSVPVRSALWALLAVSLITLTAYVWAALAPQAPGSPPNVPSSHFMRILPVQFVSVGAAAALGMFWYVYAPQPLADASRTAPPASRPKGRR